MYAVGDARMYVKNKEGEEGDLSARGIAMHTVGTRRRKTFPSIPASEIAVSLLANPPGPYLFARIERAHTVPTVAIPRTARAIYHRRAVH